MQNVDHYNWYVKLFSAFDGCISIHQRELVVSLLYPLTVKLSTSWLKAQHAHVKTMATSYFVHFSLKKCHKLDVGTVNSMECFTVQTLIYTDMYQCNGHFQLLHLFEPEMFLSKCKRLSTRPFFATVNNVNATPQMPQHLWHFISKKRKKKLFGACIDFYQVSTTFTYSGNSRAIRCCQHFR